MQVIYVRHTEERQVTFVLVGQVLWTSHTFSLHWQHIVGMMYVLHKSFLADGAILL